MTEEKENIETVQQKFEIIAWIFTSVSLLCSVVVIFITYSKKLYKNITNQFIIQISISEIINNLTQLGSIITLLIGEKELKYAERMRVCYAQIYLNLFSNFFTLCSSVIISFRIYDLLVKNSNIFKKPRNVLIAKVSSVFLCIVISYIFWITQMVSGQDYNTTSNKYVKILSCWGANSFDYGILPIYAILIGLIGYFCFKAYCFIRNYKQKMMEDNENLTEEKGNKEQLQKAKAVQIRLILDPICTAILYALISAHRIIVLATPKMKIDNISEQLNLTFILYIIPTILRGLIFGIIYFGTQKTFRQELFNYLTCKTCKKKEMKDLPNTEGMSLASISEEEE